MDTRAPRIAEAVRGQMELLGEEMGGGEEWPS